MPRTEDRINEIIQLLAWKKKRDAIKKNLLPDFKKTVILYAPPNTMVSRQPSHSSFRGICNVTNRPSSSSCAVLPQFYNSSQTSGALSVGPGPTTSQIKTIAIPYSQPGSSLMQIISTNNMTPAIPRQLSLPSSLTIATPYYQPGSSLLQINAIATPYSQPGPSLLQINSSSNMTPARSRQLSPPSSLEITAKKSKDLELEHKISENITLYYSEKEGEESAYFVLTPGKSIEILEVTKYEIVEEKVMMPSSPFMKNLK